MLKNAYKFGEGLFLKKHLVHTSDNAYSVLRCLLLLAFRFIRPSCYLNIPLFILSWSMRMHLRCCDNMRRDVAMGTNNVI